MGLILPTFTMPAGMAAALQLPQAGITPIWVPLLIVGLMLMLLWWGLTRGRVYDENMPRETVIPNPHDAEPTHDEVHGDSHPHESTADDLEQIEGIGPKIAGVLADNGIISFQGLADTSVSTLRDILKEAHLNLADPETWPIQAGLAAAGKQDEFEGLKQTLQGGRHL